MSSLDYLERLGSALAAKVPISERMDILRYYKEYFEEAGPEREQEIIRELGDPELLAEKIAREDGYLVDAEEEPSPRETRRRPGWLAPVLIFLGVIIVTATVVGGVLGWKIFRRVTAGWFGPFVHGESVAVHEAEGAVTEMEGQDGTRYFYSAPVPVDNAYIAEGSDTALSQGFSELVVDISLGDVTIQRGDSYGLSVNCQDEGSGYAITHELSGSTLRVTSPKRPGGSWGQDVKAAVVISVPYGVTLSRVSLTVGYGDVAFQDGLSAETMSASTGMGCINAYDLAVSGALALETGMGDVALNGGTLARDTKLSTGMGMVTVFTDTPGDSCAYDLSAGVGEVNVDGSITGQSAKKGSGQYQLTAQSGMGNVEVIFGN